MGRCHVSPQAGYATPKHTGMRLAEKSSASSALGVLLDRLFLGCSHPTPCSFAHVSHRRSQVRSSPHWPGINQRPMTVACSHAAFPASTIPLDSVRECERDTIGQMSNAIISRPNPRYPARLGTSWARRSSNKSIKRRDHGTST
jgi:hypothetical protein